MIARQARGRLPSSRTRRWALRLTRKRVIRHSTHADSRVCTPVARASINRLSSISKTTVSRVPSAGPRFRLRPPVESSGGFGTEHPGLVSDYEHAENGWSHEHEENGCRRESEKFGVRYQFD